MGNLMKNLLACSAIALLALTGCSAAESTPPAASEAPAASPSESTTPSASSESEPDVTVVTYKVAAMYKDESAAPVNIGWSDPLRDFTDTSGNWEESSTKFKSGDYAQVFATPRDAGVKVQCAIYVNGVEVDFQEVEESSGSIECKYTLP